MKAALQQRKTATRAMESHPQAAKQAPTSVILQRYLNKTVQKEAVPDEDELVQGKFGNLVQRQQMIAEQMPSIIPIDTKSQHHSPKSKKYLSKKVREEQESGEISNTKQVRLTLEATTNRILERYFGGRKEYELNDDEVVQLKTNQTGLPDNLKSGIENLSGLSMDDVRVHYNSPKPAQLRALAYTQGTDIHVAPGQEKHLGHEAWHVVQQKQGRVQPTMQLQGVSVNDDEGLEREADKMGEVVQRKEEYQQQKIEHTQNNCNDSIIQRMGLRPLGALVAQMGVQEKQKVADSLMQNDQINSYVNGMCYDAVAYVRYLLGARITPAQIVDIYAQNWCPIFNFTNGERWNGGGIAAGTAVGFQRVNGDSQIFHAALAIGGTIVRGINGFLLGAGWAHAWDCDLGSLTSVEGQEGVFKYPDPEKTKPPIFIRIWRSSL